MGDSSSEVENTPSHTKPKLFSENQSSSEEKGSLCQLDDQNFSLSVDKYTPDDYKRYPCEYETYAVFSFTDRQPASSHCKEKSRPVGATALAPDDSQSDTPSSDGSDGNGSHPKSKVKNNITAIADSSKHGYSGGSESEASGGVDQDRINESECSSFINLVFWQVIGFWCRESSCHTLSSLVSLFKCVQHFLVGSTL